MDIVLIAGMWLDGSAWDDVVPELEKLGHRPVATDAARPGRRQRRCDVRRPGGRRPGRGGRRGGPGSGGRPLGGVLARVGGGRRAPREGRSRRADRRLRRVPDGEKYFGFFEPVDGVVPFPGWEPFEGPDSDDMSAELKAAVAAGAIAVPAAVTQGVVSLTDERRYDVPVTLVCPEFSRRSGQGVGGRRRRARAGEDASDLDYVDIDSGHWPMFTKPVELARILADCAEA